MRYTEERWCRMFIEQDVLAKELERAKKKMSCIKRLEVSDIMLMCSYTSKAGKTKHIFLDKRKNKIAGVPSARDKKVMKIMFWIREQYVKKIGL